LQTAAAATADRGRLAARLSGRRQPGRAAELAHAPAAAPSPGDCASSEGGVQAGRGTHDRADLHERRPATVEAFICAIASIEIIGLTPEAVGNVEPSQTTRSRSSHASPSGPQTAPSGEPPMHAV